MRILETVEEGLVPLDPYELTLGGDTRMRRDVLDRGYVEWRAAAPETRTRRNDESVVAVQRSLHARGVVGLLPLAEGLAVLVRPKFPASITAMVEACEWPPVPINVLREYLPSGSASDWMLTRLVSEYLGAVEVLLDQGLMRNYIPRRTITSSPKGRVLAGATMSMLCARGIDYRVVCEYFERSEENPPNQAIREALRWSRTWSERQRKMGDHKRAGRLLSAFESVPTDPDRRFLADPYVRGLRQLPESRSAYRRALALAVALLERRGFSLDAAEGTLGLTSLLVKTDGLFEEYVRLRLRDHLVGRSLVVLDGNKLDPPVPLFEAVEGLADSKGREIPLLRGRGNKISPDILIRDTDGRDRLVIDVKYKAVKDQDGREEAHADRAAIEQCVTYGLRLGCDRVMSIHPTLEGQSSGLFVSGRVGSITVFQYRMNLGTEDLEGEATTMARSIEQVVAASSPSGAQSVPS